MIPSFTFLCPGINSTIAELEASFDQLVSCLSLVNTTSQVRGLTWHLTHPSPLYQRSCTSVRNVKSFYCIPYSLPVLLFDELLILLMPIIYPHSLFFTTPLLSFMSPSPADSILTSTRSTSTSEQVRGTHWVRSRSTTQRSFQCWMVSALRYYGQELISKSSIRYENNLIWFYLIWSDKICCYWLVFLFLNYKSTFENSSSSS